MMREPILRGADRKQPARDGGNEESTILTGFVQFLRSGIDRFGDYRVVVRVAEVAGKGRSAHEVRLDLPVAGVQCDQDREQVCLLTPGLLPDGGSSGPAGDEEDEAANDRAAESGLILRDLLNQLSTAVAQGPSFALALCDVQDPSAGDGGSAPQRRQVVVEGLKVKPRPAHRTLRFVVTVSASPG